MPQKRNLVTSYAVRPKQRLNPASRNLSYRILATIHPPLLPALLSSFLCGSLCASICRSWNRWRDARGLSKHRGGGERTYKKNKMPADFGSVRERPLRCTVQSKRGYAACLASATSISCRIGCVVLGLSHSLRLFQPMTRCIKLVGTSTRILWVVWRWWGG